MIGEGKGETGKGWHLIRCYKMNSVCGHLELCLAGGGGSGSQCRAWPEPSTRGVRELGNLPINSHLSLVDFFSLTGGVK